jgi:hypothetical protein
MCIVYFLFSFRSWKLCSFRHSTACILLHRNLNWSAGIIKTGVEALSGGAMLLTFSRLLSGSATRPLKLVSAHCRTKPYKLKIRTKDRSKYEQKGKNRKEFVWLEVLTAVTMKVVVFWVVAPCRLVSVYRRFRVRTAVTHRPNDGCSKLIPVYTAVQPRRQPSSEGNLVLVF